MSGDRFLRQRGLVRQSLLSQFEVGIDARMPELLALRIELLAEQLGCSTVRLAPIDAASHPCVVYWYGKESEGCPVVSQAASSKHAVLVCYDDSGIHLGVRGDGRNLPPGCEPAVATMAASLALSELLRLHDLLLPVELPKMKPVVLCTDVNQVSDEDWRGLRHPSLRFLRQRGSPELDPTKHRRQFLPIDGEDIALLQGLDLPEGVTVQAAGVLVHVDDSTSAVAPEDLEWTFANTPIRPMLDVSEFQTSNVHTLYVHDDDLGHPLVTNLLGQLDVLGLEVLTERTSISLPFNDLVSLAGVEGRIAVVGLGGLGTWAIHSFLACLDDVDGLARLDWLIMDPDQCIDVHNLNRQVLFTQEDLGCSKLAVVKRLLQEVRPDDKVVGALSLVEEHLPNGPTHDSVGTHFAGFDLEDDDEDWPEAPCEGATIDVVRAWFDSPSVVLGCLDSIRPRMLADALAATSGSPFLNAGVQGLTTIGKVYDVGSMLEDGWPSNDRTVVSCGGMGSIPVASIVLTNAFAGALLSLQTGQLLAGGQPPLRAYCWRMRDNSFSVGAPHGKARQASAAQMVANLFSSSVNAGDVTDDTKPLSEA